MSQNLIHSLFRKEVLAMSAYPVADPGKLIKLDAMENPYQWPEQALEQWLKTIKNSPLNRYPDPQAKSLAAVLKTLYQVPTESELILGNGSDEIIQILLMALAPDAHIVTPEPGFVMYKQIARSLGLNYHGIALNAEDFSLDMPAMLAAIEQYNPALIFLAYPNNPTGNLFSEQQIKTLLQATEGLVVIDEAYAPFTDATFMQSLTDYPNLLVMRTVSKLGLAGLRLGYMVGDKNIIAELDKIRLPYNINILTQITTEFALQHGDFLTRQTQTLRQERDALLQQLLQIEQIKAFPSSANFILFKSLNKDASAVFESIRNQGILIKNMSAHHPLLENCLRVTIGTEQENALFLSALKKALH